MPTSMPAPIHGLWPAVAAWPESDIAPSLAEIDGVLNAEGKALWPAGQRREGLPTDGVLGVFHDLRTYGDEPEATRAAWRCGSGRVIWRPARSTGPVHDLHGLTGTDGN